MKTMQNRFLAVTLCTLVIVPAAEASLSNFQTRWWDQHILTSDTNWGICSSCSSSSYYKRWQSSPSLSGKSTLFHIGGSKPYMAVLWNQSVVRWATKDGKDVVTHTRHFVYDAYFYVKNISAMEAIEFDWNQFLNGKQYTWGHECRGNKAGNEWDVWKASSWDKGKGYWRTTGIPCYPKAYSWNHVRLEGKRTWDNRVYYISITMNGKKHYLNRAYAPGPANSDWHAITVNFQLAGDSAMHDYSVWTDKMAFSYWF